jgi:hypothetical protein
MAFERVGRTGDALREYKTYLSMDPNGADAGRLREHVDTMAARGATQSASVSR